MRKMFIPRSGQIGMPPGTIVHTGKHTPSQVCIDVIEYDEGSLNEQTVADVNALSVYGAKRPRVTWINVIGVHDAALLEKLGELMGIHTLVLENIANTTQRPKVENYEDLLYVVLRMLRNNETSGEIDAEQVSLVLGENLVISFQERAGDVFDDVRARLRAGKSRIRKMGPDYLLYALMDAIVDHYFLILERFSEHIETLENRVMSGPDDVALPEIYRLKTELIFLRRSVWPLREAVSNLEKSETPLIRKTTKVFLRDIYDHAVQLMDTLETFRDVVSGLYDIYLSSVSNRMNEVMKVLTVIATIFIPLTFIAGVYGMNFELMPELKFPWGYPAALGAMLAVAVWMLLFFRRKGWL